MLELLTLFGFERTHTAVEEPHDSSHADDEPPQSWAHQLADEALLAELVVFHRAERC